MTTPQKDYFAIYRPLGKRASHLCNVRAYSPADAMRVTRQSHKLPRGSFARRIGREGYFAMLRKVFGAPTTTTNRP